MKKLRQLRGFVLGVTVTLIVCLGIVPAVAEGFGYEFNSIGLNIRFKAVEGADENYQLSDGSEVPYTILYNGTTYVPIRKVGELLDMDVEWSEKTNTAYLYDKINPNDYKPDVFVLEGAENVRDIGGYATEDGKRVNTGVFVRAAKLTNLTEADIDTLTAYGLDLNLDFRGDDEIAADPDPDFGCATANVKIPLPGALTDTIADNYIASLEQGQAEYKAVMELLADTQYETTIYHCTAGKDRTGLTTMLLLDLAGVSRDTILYDYAISRQLGPRQNMNVFENLTELSMYESFHAIPEGMGAAYDHLHSQYGGAEGFMKHIGVSDEAIESLYNKLVG